MKAKRSTKRNLFAELGEGMASLAASRRGAKKAMSVLREDREDVALVRRARKTGGRASSIADVRKKLGLNKCS
jgi:hypothetical protein